MSKSKVLSDWNFWPTLSNRRLSVTTFYTPFKLRWSIDRITIVGYLKYDLVGLGKYLCEKGWAKEGYSGFNLVSDWDENIAYLEVVKYSDPLKPKGRIDFNPNKLGKWLDSDLKIFIHKLFDFPHFSRADVAVDMFNLPNGFVSQYRINEPVRYMPIYGKSGNIESFYWGSRASQRQVRMYNKFIEQNRKKEYIHESIKSWWRLEIQLRRDKAKRWSEIVDETLKSFCSLQFMPNTWKATDKIMLVGLIERHEFWADLSRPTKYKYRNMLKEISENDALTIELNKSFKEYEKSLHEELLSWLMGIDVTDSMDED